MAFVISIKPKTCDTCPMPEISVIVPFYGDKKKLLTCLESIQSSSLESSQYEIIVVDNHDTPVLSGDFMAAVTSVHEKTPGSYAARNKGIQVASGAFLFFTDADVVVDSLWLEKGLAFLKERPNSLVGGKINLTFDKQEAPSSLELYEKIFYFQQEQYVKEEKYGATANLFGAKEIFQRLGGFDSSLRSGGDQEFCQRALVSGVELHYCDSACVDHPSRSSLKEFLKRRLRAFSGNLLLFYRRHGLNNEMVKEKLAYFLKPERMREWNGDWAFFDSLPASKKKAIKRWHYLMCLFDAITLLYCKGSYQRLKRLTLIERS